MPPGEPYPHVAASPSFPAMEEEILGFWFREQIFEASVRNRPAGDEGSNEYVFYDGPPFANGLPHYGHLLTGFVKDAIPRYQTMRGRRVERRFGWDCHGLPAETEAEKELGVSGRGPITAYGIDKFNEYCRASVQRYTEEWQRYVTRQARWVDFAHDYKTMDLSYMESVLWAFKALHQRGLLYEAYRVLPYCWECETPLSNSETRQDDAYRDRQDPAVTVGFQIDADPDAAAPLDAPFDLWAWTTTPWTLPSNLALAVGPEVEYSLFDLAGRRVALASACAEAYAAQLQGAELLGTFAGSAIVGRTYRPLFPYFAEFPGAFRVLAGDFVTTTEGTGVVHLAPGFGEDDQRVCAQAGIGVVCPVDDRGRFTAEVTDFTGTQVFEANRPITARLREEGRLVNWATYVHSYPHCWRTDTPLIYKAVTSWFVEVTALKERMLEHNQSINWVPAHVRDGSFGKWLAGARDWSISRNRFWGSPIPVWKSDDPAYPRVDVYGSLDELEADFGVRPTDLHRPAIDELTRPNPDDPTGRSTMRRVPEVLDCWFESGSMPYAQVHYPFENEGWFEHHFPGDFIVEYIGQTRAWFYNLHVLATALFDRNAFRSCLAHGIVLGADGRKMSKRLRNYPDPEEVFAKYGADAMRWALLSSAVLRGGDMVLDESCMSDAVRDALLPLWRAWHFFSLYANAGGKTAALDRPETPESSRLDAYILAKLRELVEEVTEAMEGYDLWGACRSLQAFFDALSNWYIRRSRDRFWATAKEYQDQDLQDAVDTLGTVLEVVCRVAAPLLPLEAEAIWRGLTGGLSVHLTDWPEAKALPANSDLVSAMDRVREVCSAAHSIRKAQGLRARLPLRSLTVAEPDAEALAPFKDLIADEVNVKNVILTSDVGELADRSLSVVFKVAAPRLGAATQAVAAASRAGDFELLEGGRARVGGSVLEPGEFEMRLVPVHPEVSRTLGTEAGLVVLDPVLDSSLIAEGTARDVVRAIQQHRRDIGLDVSDRIRLWLSAPASVTSAVSDHAEWVREQVLAVELVVGAGASPADGSATVEMPEGYSLALLVEKA